MTGSRGEGARNDKGHVRTCEIAVPGKDITHCSDDPMLGGDCAKRYPEDLLLSVFYACHRLWYLHLVSNAGNRKEQSFYFIARSVNFPVRHQATFEMVGA